MCRGLLWLFLLSLRGEGCKKVAGEVQKRWRTHWKFHGYVAKLLGARNLCWTIWRRQSEKQILSGPWRTWARGGRLVQRCLGRAEVWRSQCFAFFLLDFHGSNFVPDVSCAPNIEPSSTGRSTVNAFSASCSTLTSAWFSWSTVRLRWLQRVLYHLGHHGRVLPLFRPRYRVSAKTPAWFLLKYPRNSSIHWLVFLPIRLLSLYCHPMTHVDVAHVLVSSPHIPS